MEFWRYYRIIRRRRWLILLGMAICVGLVAYSNYNSVPSFVGRTTLMESKGMSQEGTPLFPEQYMMQMDAQLRLSNLCNIAMSNEVMQAAAGVLADLDLKFTPQEILSFTSVVPQKDTNIIAVEVTIPAAWDGDRKDYESYQQELPPGAPVMTFKEYCSARASYIAATAADVIASEFKKTYDRINNDPVTQSREFVEAQIPTARKSMLQAQAALRQFKESNGIVELTAQSQALVQRLQQAKITLAQSEAAYQAAIARAKKQGEELKAMMARAKEQGEEIKGMDVWEKVSETTALNPDYQQLRQQLVQLETTKAAKMGNRDTGKSGWGQKSPDAQALEKQIADTNEQLRAIAAKQYIRSSTTQAKSNLQQSTVDKYIVAQVEEVAAGAQVEALSNEVNSVREEMASIPAQDAKFAELDTDVKSAVNTYGLMKQKLDEARIREQKTKGERALTTIDKATWSPVPDKGAFKLILALILSPIFGIGAAFLLYYTDNTVKTAAEAEKLLGMPVLCAIPEARAHSFTRQRCSEMMDVAYQMLTSNIWVASQNHDLNGLVVVSAEPNMGRSVTASNLAVSLAREGARVVLVDADLRKPSQHLLFGVDNKVGLTNVLSGGASLEDALIPTKIQGLLLVPTGPVPENPVKLLRSEQMKSIDEQIKDVADFVIYDTPAGVTFPDPVLVAAHVGAAVVVHSAGRVPRGSEADLCARLESVGVNMLGAVLNKVKREDSSSYFHYRRSYQGMATPQLPGGKKASIG